MCWCGNNDMKTTKLIEVRNSDNDNTTTCNTNTNNDDDDDDGSYFSNYIIYHLSYQISENTYI